MGKYLEPSWRDVDPLTEIFRTVHPRQCGNIPLSSVGPVVQKPCRHSRNTWNQGKLASVAPSCLHESLILVRYQDDH